MHGTPVSTANLYPTGARDGRYDASLLRQVTPPSHQGASLVKESGSITQGEFSANHQCTIMDDLSNYVYVYLLSQELPCIREVRRIQILQPNTMRSRVTSTERPYPLQLFILLDHILLVTSNATR